MTIQKLGSFYEYYNVGVHKLFLMHPFKFIFYISLKTINTFAIILFYRLNAISVEFYLKKCVTRK